MPYPGLGLHLRQIDMRKLKHKSYYPEYDPWSKLLPVRELAMMHIMDQLTDKKDWEKKVFDDTIVSKWREEALAMPDSHFMRLSTSGKGGWTYADGNLTRADDGDIERIGPTVPIMTGNTFDCCIKELQSKALYYQKSGVVPTLDASASVVKSDSLVHLQLQNDLRNAFAKLKADQSDSPDWHPRSNGMVQDLVHPSMYPLVYGQSRVFRKEVVGVQDAIDKWAGKGDVIPTPIRGERRPFGLPDEAWSDTYQWLPANFALRKDNTVRFTSYINNLHPTKYPDIYKTIEELIQVALPAFDQCIAHFDYADVIGTGRKSSRFSLPEDPGDDNNELWEPSHHKAMAGIKMLADDRYNRYDECWHEDEDEDEEDSEEEDDEIDLEKHEEKDEKNEDEIKCLKCKWVRLRKARIPEPEFEEVDYAPPTGRRLVDKFDKLQVIVKIVSIELTPEKPEFPAGGWHIEGMRNERICASALYYLDSENVTTSHLSFRMQTSSDTNADISVPQEQYTWLEKFYGTELGTDAPCLQNYGSVETRPGRLLVFPNVFQHRVSSFQLEDPTKPGYRRFIALWLVDPAVPIISTANVPPQQADWWAEAIFNRSSEAHAKLPGELRSMLEEKGFIPADSGEKYPGGVLPVELMQMVRDYFNADGNPLPMNQDETKAHRLKLMDERTVHQQKAEGEWYSSTYSFCEH